MIRHQTRMPAPPAQRRRARAIAATRSGREAVLARATALAATLLLGLAIITAGADAALPGGPATEATAPALR